MKKAIPYQSSVWFLMPLWVLITGALLIWTSWQLYENHLFADHAQSIYGTVTRKFVRVTQGKKGPVHHLCVDYRYNVGNMSVNCETEAQYDTWPRIHEHELIPLKYLPEDPSNNRIDSVEEDEHIVSYTRILIGFSVVSLVAGSLGFTYVIRRNKKNLWLLSEGASCSGRITSIPYDLVGKYQRKAYYLVLTYRDNQGREITGKTWYLKSGQVSRWKEGNHIKVYYDPANSGAFTVDINR